MTGIDFNKLFIYSDGNIYRRKPSGGEKAGALAGWVTQCNGRNYRKVNIYGRSLYVHRVIYMMHHADNPKVIDHINGNPLDNRIENLRAADQRKNIANAKLSRANTSGYKGVTWRSDTKKWSAQIMVDGRHIALGCHLNVEDAAKAYAEASVKYFGEFAKPARSQEATARHEGRAVQ